MDMEQTVIRSPLGPLTLFSGSGRLVALLFGDFGGWDDTPLFRETARQMEEYFTGVRKTFRLPLDPGGTAFQRRVWDVLCGIPWGATLSYREVACRAGSPNGSRAVGQACSRNPLPVLIPCHRVISSDGRPGGYAGGPERKRFLLDLEGIPLRGVPF